MVFSWYDLKKNLGHNSNLIGNHKTTNLSLWSQVHFISKVYLKKIKTCKIRFYNIMLMKILHQYAKEDYIQN